MPEAEGYIRATDIIPSNCDIHESLDDNDDVFDGRELDVRFQWEMDEGELQISEVTRIDNGDAVILTEEGLEHLKEWCFDNLDDEF